MATDISALPGASSQQQSNNEPVITPRALMSAGPVLPGAGCS